MPTQFCLHTKLRRNPGIQRVVVCGANPSRSKTSSTCWKLRSPARLRRLPCRPRWQRCPLRGNNVQDKGGCSLQDGNAGTAASHFKCGSGAYLVRGAVRRAHLREQTHCGLPWSSKRSPLRFGVDIGAQWDAHIPLSATKSERLQFHLFRQWHAR